MGLQAALVEAEQQLVAAGLAAGHDVLLVLDGGGEEVEDELASLAGPHALRVELAEVSHEAGRAQTPGLQGHGRLPVGAPLQAAVVAPEDLEAAGAVLAHQQALHLRVAGGRALQPGHGLPALQAGLQPQGDLLHELRRQVGVVEDPEEQADPGPASAGVRAQGEPAQGAAVRGQLPPGEDGDPLGAGLLDGHGIGHRQESGSLPAVAGDHPAREAFRQAAALQLDGLDEGFRAAADPEAQDPRVDADAFSVGDGREPAGRRGRLHLPAVLQGEAAGEICRAGGKVEEQPADAAIVPAGQDPRLQGERLSRGPGEADAGGFGEVAPGKRDPPGRRIALRRQAARRVEAEGVPGPGRGRGRLPGDRREGDGTAGGVPLPGQRLRAQGHVAEEQPRVELLSGRFRVGESVPAPHPEEELVAGQPFRRGHAVEDAQGQVELLPRRQIREPDLDVAAGALGVPHVPLPDEAPVHQDLLEAVTAEVVGRGVGVGPALAGLVPAVGDVGVLGEEVEPHRTPPVRGEARAGGQGPVVAGRGLRPGVVDMAQAAGVGDLQVAAAALEAPDRAVEAEVDHFGLPGAEGGEECPRGAGDPIPKRHSGTRGRGRHRPGARRGGWRFAAR